MNKENKQEGGLLKVNNVYLGDCLELMQCIPDKSVDMVLCDLP
jgi:DNA modification methylase